MRMTGIAVDRIVDGKVVEGWMEMDTHHQMQQLGLIPRRESPASRLCAPCTKQIRLVCLLYLNRVESSPVCGKDCACKSSEVGGCSLLLSNG